MEDEPGLTLNDVKILVITECYWGKADNLADALRIAYNPKKYQAFICHKNTTVDELGRCTFPAKYLPREIFRKGIRGKPFISFARKQELESEHERVE